MKFELKLCPYCRVMTNHFIKNGDEVCGKCRQLTKKIKQPKFISDLLGV